MKNAVWLLSLIPATAHHLQKAKTLHASPGLSPHLAAFLPVSMQPH